MQVVVLNVDPSELQVLKTVLGIDVLIEGVTAMAEQIQQIVEAVNEIKEKSDRITAGVDRLVQALDETNLSGADRAALDSALATLRSEVNDLNTAADKASARVPEPGEEDPEEPTDPENPGEPGEGGEPVQGARKKVRKSTN